MVTCSTTQLLPRYLRCIFPSKLFQNLCELLPLLFYVSFRLRIRYFFHSYFLHLFHFFLFRLCLCLCEGKCHLLKKCHCDGESSCFTMVNRWEHKISKTRCVWACKKNGHLTIIQVQKWNKRPKWMLFCVYRTHTHALAHANLCTIKSVQFPSVIFGCQFASTQPTKQHSTITWANNYELVNMWHVSSNTRNIEHYCLVRPLHEMIIELTDGVCNFWTIEVYCFRYRFRNA